MKIFRVKIQKIFFLIAIILVLPQWVSAQFCDTEGCGTHGSAAADMQHKPWKGDNAFLYSYLDNIGYDENKVQVYYRVPVKFWVYRRSSGEGGVSERYLRERIRELNYYYSVNNTGIRFYMHPEISYIDSDRLYVLKFMTTGFRQALRGREKGCINVLITSNLIQRRSGRRPKEYHGVHNGISKNIIIRHKIASQTLSHEIGHYFGLKHPHQNWKRGKLKQEAVSRTRTHPGLFKSGAVCEYNGDKLCDTPAEPNMSKYTDEDCNYIGYTLTDNWGERYEPDTDNIMSYGANRECRTNFTKGQIAVMLYTAENNKYSKYWDARKNANSAFDIHEPNNTQSTASDISLNTSHGNTFHLMKYARRGPVFYDALDWFHFEIKSEKPAQYVLTIEKGPYPMPQKMTINFYKEDGFKKAVSAENVQRKEILLGRLDKGHYYIKITNDIRLNYITGYKMAVNQK